MKKIIRKWLGIVEIENTLMKKADTKTEIELRQIVGKAVESALAGESDREWNFSVDFSNTLNRALERASTFSAKHEIEKHINTETFLDSIVKRIMDKQLRG